ncbi:hypothetical protein BMS3Abin15_01199 [bacterium BMS3Abin15]|nr:hypothetical protein BMS3Abin15_01199 [bacterium BMS3Abin15]
MQNNNGLKEALKTPWIYDLFQSFVGEKRARKWIARNIWKCNSGENIVDIGCGTGLILNYLPDDIQYTGFDKNENYIQFARKKFGDRGRFLVGTPSDYLKSGESELNMADIVLCNGLLHHLKDKEVLEVFKLSNRIMAHSGRLVCIEPSFLAKQSTISKWLLSQDRGGFVRSEKEWKEITGKVFSSFSTSIVTGLLRIPYIHIIIECNKVSG